MTTPLTRRDKGLLLGSGVVAAVVALFGALYLVFDTGSRKGETCFTATFAASIGGATVHHCGADAVAYCRVNGARAPRVAEACRRAGFAVGALP
jgi:hypothetical protein